MERRKLEMTLEQVSQRWLTDASIENAFGIRYSERMSSLSVSFQLERP